MKLSRRVVVPLALIALGIVAWRFLLVRPEVTVARVTVGDAAQVVYATGLVEPVTWAKVSALQRKRILDICRCEGREVKKGDVLVRLDDIEEQAQLAEITARRDRIREDAERIKVLVDRNVTSRVAYDEKLTQLREYEARLAAQRDRILDLELRAPMDGIVLRRDGEVGEIAGIGTSDVLLWIGQPKPLRIVADINEEDIVRVKPDQVVLVRHDSQGGVPLQATVASITPKGDSATKTFRAYFALPDDTPLMIGMSIEANIVVREVKQTLLVPAEALSGGQVQVVEGGRIRLQTVRTGVVGTRMVEIVEGVAKDQVVVVPSRAGLKTGDKVSVSRRSGP